MARYTASTTKLSRRVGKNLYLKGARSFSAKDDYTKKPFRPSKNNKRKTFGPATDYGRQLVAKQSLRFTYGLLEKQLANIFKKAFQLDGNTGELALTLIERRIDNVIYRAGLANSRAQARQLVNHGHFLLNGVKANIPSMLVKKGDKITIKQNKERKNFWSNFQLQIPNDIPSWISVGKNREISILNEPLSGDLPVDFNISSIVEFYSRKVA